MVSGYTWHHSYRRTAIVTQLSICTPRVDVYFQLIFTGRRSYVKHMAVPFTRQDPMSGGRKPCDCATRELGLPGEQLQRALARLVRRIWMTSFADSLGKISCRCAKSCRLRAPARLSRCNGRVIGLFVLRRTHSTTDRKFMRHVQYRRGN